MPQFNSCLLAAISSLLLATLACAQDTNAPRTRLEAFEGQTDILIVRGAALVGDVHAGAGLVSVVAKESKVVASGLKEYGVAIGVTKAATAPEDSTVVDYDELDSLISALDYVSGVNYSITPLPSFDAGFTSRGGLRVFAYTSLRRPGTVQAAVQGGHMANARLLLAPAQLAQFTTLIRQAKTQLDTLRATR
ncbi:MAG: hypothetical protein ABSC03_07215 [Verrucomicrobiota bacterium]|jgi:hypothetical protein